MSLNAKAWLGLGFVVAVMALALSLSAGTLRYWQGWAFLAVFFAASLLITLDLMKTDPALLARRVRGGPTAEREPAQRVAMFFASAGFLALLVVPGLDHRFGWSTVPVPVVVGGDVLTAAGFYAVYRVFKANPYASSTVEVAGGQTVVTTGPYTVVRHPMYAGSLLYLLGMPLALGSYWGLLALAAMMPFLIWRLLDEERLLSAKLQGYAEYRTRVRWRLVPGLF